MPACLGFQGLACVLRIVANVDGAFALHMQIWPSRRAKAGGLQSFEDAIKLSGSGELLRPDWCEFRPFIYSQHFALCPIRPECLRNIMDLPKVCELEDRAASRGADICGVAAGFSRALAGSTDLLNELLILLTSSLPPCGELFVVRQHPFSVRYHHF